MVGIDDSTYVYFRNAHVRSYIRIHLLEITGCLLLIVSTLWVSARINGYISKSLYDEMNSGDK